MSGRRRRREIQTLIAFAMSLSKVQNQHLYSKSTSKNIGLLQSLLLGGKKPTTLECQFGSKNCCQLEEGGWSLAVQFSCALKLSTARPSSPDPHHPGQGSGVLKPGLGFQQMAPEQPGCITG